MYNCLILIMTGAPVLRTSSPIHIALFAKGATYVQLCMATIHSQMGMYIGQAYVITKC